MSFEKITIEATINADSATVWDKYTNPSHIVNWNFAHESWCCPSAENDLSVGGKYKARMEARDGSFGFDFEATYLELENGKRFVYQLSDERLVAVSLAESNGKTDLKIVFDAETENPIEMQKGGWDAILQNFKAYAENK